MKRCIARITIAALVLGSGPAFADESLCTGKNLIPQIEVQEPAIAAELAREAAATPYGVGLTWKLEKEGLKPSYLFGTIHLSDPRLLTLKPEVAAAFDSSTVLALEITEVLDPKKMAAVAFSSLKYSTYGDGTTLDDRLSKPDIASLDSAVRKKLGLPWVVARKMKPWALMGALALPACEMARKRANKQVVDVSLGTRAQKQGKEIVPLETLISQLQAMDSLPEAVSINGLVQSISLGSRMDDLFETMIQLYLKEETATVWALMRRVGEKGFVPAKKNAEYAAFQKIIVDKRNQTMVAEAESHLKNGGVFVAVGALHLPGQSGMLNILAQNGYHITRVRP